MDLSAQELRGLTSRTRDRHQDPSAGPGARAAGLGNAYVHDVLFLARLHPLRPSIFLTDAEVEGLHQAIRISQPSIDKGGASTRPTFVSPAVSPWMTSFGGYKEGKPSSALRHAHNQDQDQRHQQLHHCPTCQPLEPLHHPRTLSDARALMFNPTHSSSQPA